MNHCASTQALDCLHAALANALVHGELFLQYQPIVDRSQKIIGMEALMRWNSAEFGEIPPSSFVPLAEKSRAILFMGAWALEEGCRQLQRWSLNPTTAEWSLSINVSPLQFDHLSFADNLITLIKHHDINPGKLILEITENVFLSISESKRDSFNRLRDAGIGIAVDDFGTGFSSMRYLRHLSISRIKIPKIFIDEITYNKKDQGIVAAIVTLAQTLKADVVAEGVETTEQLELLMQVGCSAFQGFLFGRPAQPSDFL